jgi:hypothetical protein
LLGLWTKPTSFVSKVRGFGGFDEVERLPSPMVAGRFDSRFDELEIARVGRN